MRSRYTFWIVLLGALTIAGVGLMRSDKFCCGRLGSLVGPPANAAAQLTEVPVATPTVDTVRFAVIGDTGTGDRKQVEVAAQLTKARQNFPFEFVLMVGDNMYGAESQRDYQRKFELPYKQLLETGVKFYAALGNHDNTNQRFYAPFNMGGQRYYTFRKGNASFFALDSTYMNPEQLRWLENELKAANTDWKICYFHHPLYSSGKAHGPDLDLRARVEPLLVKHGVDVVLTGHEHFYERIQPQRGIYYFIQGASAKLRARDIRRTRQTVKGFDTDLSFMLMEIAGHELRFKALSRTGELVDSDVLQNTQRNQDSTSVGTPEPSQALR